MDPKYKTEKLFHEEYNYDGWSENEELSEKVIKKNSLMQ